MKIKYRLFLIVFLSFTSISFADSVKLTMENDTFSFPKSDENYTHGTEIAYMSDNAWWIFDNVGFEIEQTMYGPKLDKTDNMKQGEHPYCGYLSFDFVGNQWFGLGFADLSLQHSFGLGGVGPHSYSEKSQKYIHKWLGCKDPKGWKKWQIKDEFIVQYEIWANLNVEAIDANWFKMFVIPRIGADVGGFKDMLAAGLDLKFGLNAPKNVGHGMILSAPSLKNANEQYDDYSFYTLVGVEGRCVFHDTSIDGGFFRDSPYTLDSETWVGEFHWGVGMNIRNFEVSYFNFIRSKEFATSRIRPNYGQIKIGWRF